MSILASLALLGATASAAATYGSIASVGSAHVVNKCNYDVILCNTPADNGGHEQIDQTLKPGESYDQSWTQLDNDAGWSIKLYKDQTKSSVLQYEYTFHGDGIIWYDLSCVDGNPWDKDWEITSNGTECNPKQQAYRYSTDDAYGMQSCPQASAITVTLCTGTTADDGNSVDADSSSDSDDSNDSSSSKSAPAYDDGGYTTPSATPAYDDGGYTTPSATPTTFATAVKTQNTGGAVVTVVEVVTEVAWAEVTAYADKNKRHAHHSRHQHHG